MVSSTKYIKTLGRKDIFIKKNFNFINDKKYLTLKKLSKIKPKYIFTMVNTFDFVRFWRPFNY